MSYCTGVICTYTYFHLPFSSSTNLPTQIKLRHTPEAQSAADDSLFSRIAGK